MEDDRSASETAADELTEAGSVASQGENRFDEVDAQRAADKKQRGRPFYFKRYKAGPLLLALFIIMLVCAFLLYPRRSALYRPGSAFAHIYTTVERIDTSLSWSVSRSGAIDGYDASISLNVMPTKMVTHPISIVDVPLPAGIRPENCGQALGGVCTYHSGLLTAKPVFTAAQPSNGGRAWTGSVDILFARLPLPWQSNGLEVEGQLPVISVGPLSQLPGFKPQPWTPSNPDVTVDYYVPDPTSHDWVGGPVPSVFPSRPCGVCLGGRYPGYVEWITSLSALSAPVAVSGTNKSAAEWDSFRTFAAGVLAGVAGGRWSAQYKSPPIAKTRSDGLLIHHNPAGRWIFEQVAGS
jgi:hypothetical protein